MTRSFTALCAAALLGLVANAGAQEFPSRQIVLIVPFPARGSTDAIARIVAEPMRVLLGQPVVVQNIAGAGATIGVGRAIQSPPDGYTLSVGNWTSHVGASAVYKGPWSVLADLEPVAMLSISSLVIVGRTGLPAKDGKEFIAWVRANPDKANAATVGAGSGAHVCGIYFAQKTGTRFRYGTGNTGSRSPDVGGLRRLPQVRGRSMVAAHQVSEHQGRLTDARLN